MKYLIIIIMCCQILFPSSSIADEYSSVVSTYFEEILFTNVNGTEKIELKFRGNGPRYNYIYSDVSGEEYGSIEFGGIFTLNENESIRFATRGSSLSIVNFKYIADNKKDYFEEAVLVNGWYIESKLDFRSFRGGLQTIGFYVSVNPEPEQKANLIAKYENINGYKVIDKGNLLVVAFEY